jgi:hypothetical protein
MIAAVHRVADGLAYDEIVAYDVCEAYHVFVQGYVKGRIHYRVSSGFAAASNSS